MSKISIIIPVYNVEKYLKQCLDSVLKQTLQDIEVICVNDGSKDRSLEILKEFQSKDNRVKIIDKPNSGYGASMNAGINKAVGEYIGIIESDDFTTIDMYENLFNIAKEFDADVVKSDWYDYWSDKDFSRKNNRISPAKTNKILNAEIDESILRIDPSVWSAIYRKEFLDKNNIRFLETPGASYQDLSFTFKVYSLAQKVILTDKAYLHYRRDNENSSVKSKTKVYCVCDEYNEIDKFIENHPEFSLKIKVQKEILQYNAYVSSAIRISEDLRPEFIDVFSKHFKDAYEQGIINSDFFKKINKKEFFILLNNKNKFLKVLKQREFKRKFNIARKKILSIHFRDGRLNITCFGKEIV